MNVTVNIERQADSNWYGTLKVNGKVIFRALRFKGSMTYEDVHQTLVNTLNKDDNIMQTKLTKYSMLTLGYTVMNYLMKNASRDELVWKDYHGFPIAEVPKDWYKDVRKALGIKSKEFTLQIGKCDYDDYYDNKHHHEIGHQVVIVLGPRTGFMEPEGKIYIGHYIYDATEESVHYFNTGVSHGFEGSFYFVNIQSPPLVTEDGNDDYVEEI